MTPDVPVLTATAPATAPAPAPATTARLADHAAGRRARPVVSFELFPPRSPAARDALTATVGHLAAAQPDFVSVTYGASGSAHGASRELVQHVVGATGVPVVAHVTCVGRDEAALARTVADFLDDGVHGFLALRGDPPRNEPDWVPSPDSVASGADLVSLVHRVARERDGHRPDVAVAAFPGGHPASTGLDQDVAVLRGKEEAGAGFAITQLFFDPASYLELVDAARAAGVGLPIVPGIMPLTDPGTLQRLSTLTGVPAPAALLAELEALDGPARHRRGVAATVELARAVLDTGAPGVHLYSMNRHEAVLDVLDALRLPAPGT